MCFKKNEKFKSGFSFVEVLIAVFIVSVVFTSFYTVSMVGTRFIVEAKNRLAATALLNEKMEIIRNLQYDAVGLQGGIPDGNILEDEDLTVNSRSFHVHTFIQYVDDPMDGVYPADTIPNDYKSVKVVISWNDSAGAAQQISSVSRFVPPGLETSDGGAPLAINVTGSDAQGIAQASVKIVNNNVSPAINFTVQTDDTGHLMLPAAPASLGKYQITINKNGYETVATVDPTTVTYVPTYANATVLLGSLNSYSYIEDKLSNLTIQAIDLAGSPVGGIQFSISGGKVIGRDSSNNNVTNMSDSSSTDATTGQKQYSAISPGNYKITVSPNAQYDLIAADPAASPLAIVPGSNATYTLLYADKNINSLVATVTDSVSNLPIAGAKITLTDSLGSDVFTDSATAENGILFFPNSASPLAAGNYTLKITADGYTDQIISSVSINKLTKESIKMVKS